MSTSRVAQVRLRLRIPAELAPSAARVREHVERELVVQVLEQLELLLHRRFGAHTVFRIRRLALGWRIDAHELGARDLVERLAADLAEQIIADATAMPAAERARPRGESFAIFDDDRHLDAVYLADAADGEARRWLHAERSDPAATWQELAQLGAPAVAAVVQWLRTFERLDAAIALAAEATRAEIAALVPEVAPIVELVRARARAARLPTVAQTRDGTPHVEPPPAAPGETPSPDVADAAHVAGAASGERPPSSPHAVAPDERALDAAPPVREITATPADAATRLPADVPGAVAAELSEPLAIDTDAAGLFYLAGRVLEIDLAERLWAAGLPEGVVLAEIAAAILGANGDRAVHWFGGAFDRLPGLPTVEAWAVAEIVDTVQHALGRRLVALGVTLTPAELDASLDGLAREVRTTHDPRGLVHRLVARGVASIAAIVAARLGEPPSLDQLRAVCMRPGRLVLLPDELHVVMSHHAIDLDHRRAGLDQDPGHVPWLGRRLRFEFVGGDIL